MGPKGFEGILGNVKWFFVVRILKMSLIISFRCYFGVERNSVFIPRLIFDFHAHSCRLLTVSL